MSQVTCVQTRWTGRKVIKKRLTNPTLWVRSVAVTVTERFGNKQNTTSVIITLLSMSKTQISFHDCKQWYKRLYTQTAKKVCAYHIKYVSSFCCDFKILNIQNFQVAITGFQWTGGHKKSLLASFSTPFTRHFLA